MCHLSKVKFGWRSQCEDWGMSEKVCVKEKAIADTGKQYFEILFRTSRKELFR